MSWAYQDGVCFALKPFLLMTNNWHLLNKFIKDFSSVIWTDFYEHADEGFWVLECVCPQFCFHFGIWNYFVSENHCQWTTPPLMYGWVSARCFLWGWFVIRGPTIQVQSCTLFIVSVNFYGITNSMAGSVYTGVSHPSDAQEVAATKGDKQGKLNV